MFPNDNMKPPNQNYIPSIVQDESSGKIIYPPEWVAKDIISNFGKKHVKELTCSDIVDVYVKYWRGTDKYFCENFGLDVIYFQMLLKKEMIYNLGIEAIKGWLAEKIQGEGALVPSVLDPVMKRELSPIGSRRIKVEYDDKNLELKGIHLLSPAKDPLLTEKTYVGYERKKKLSQTT